MCESGAPRNDKLTLLQSSHKAVSRVFQALAPSTWESASRAAKTSQIAVKRYMYRSKCPLLFVNRQTYEEFTSVLGRTSTVKLHIKDSNQSDRPLWNMSSMMASQIKRCEMKLLATPGMTGSFDPRIAPADWPLGDRAVEEMEGMKSLERMSLQIHACGNQIWNPAWLWHYTCQSFKRSQLAGFKEISFHLKADGWFAGENRLCRNDKGQWEWRCPRDHFVRPDTVGTMPIREFCGALYDECDQCSSLDDAAIQG